MFERKRILIVDDEEFVHEFLGYTLKRGNYKIISAYSGEEAISKANSEYPDLIILDLALPGLRGEDVLLKIRGSRSKNIPILILSSHSEPEDIARLLKMGADDFMSKPYVPKLLLAKIRLLLRRRSLPKDRDVINVDDLVIDKNRHEVLIDGKPIETTRKEFSIICLLFENPGTVINRNRIFSTIDESKNKTPNRSVDVHIASIRKKLKLYRNSIRTVRGIGYKFAK